MPGHLIVIVTLIRLNWCAREQKVTAVLKNCTLVILLRFCLQVMQWKKVLHAQRTCIQDVYVRSSAQDVLLWK